MLCFGICHQLELKNQLWYGIFAFSSTLFTYNLQRYLKAIQLLTHPTNLIVWVISKKKVILFILFLSGVICSVSFIMVYNWRIDSLLVIAFSALVSLFYILKIKNRSLRDIPFLKIHLIALIWVIDSGVFQLINEENYSIKNWFFIGIHYFYILAVTIPFDIRDLKYDDPNQKTIPQLFGIRNSKIISIVLLIIYVSLAILINHQLMDNLFFLIAVTLTLFLIIGIHEKRKEYYFSGLIEGSIFIIGASYLVK